MCRYLDRTALLTFGQRFLGTPGISFAFKYKVNVLDPSRSGFRSHQQHLPAVCLAQVTDFLYVHFFIW